MSIAEGVAPALRRHAWRVLVVALALALLGTVTWRATQHASAAAYTPPQNGRMESELGVRFTRADVVGGGGIVELRYVVLDAVKAARFQADTHHPPTLRNEGKTNAVSRRTALMKQGHQLRAGQEYYILYLDSDARIRAGDKVEIVKGSNLLKHFPVR